MDLLRNKLIPDPFYRDNEKSLQWIGLTDWEYQTEFEVDAATLVRGHVDLQFSGLDTYADVYLNDAELLKADNMFRSWRLPVKDRLRAGKNTLRIVFHSPVMLMMPKVKALPFRLPTVGQVQIVSEEGIATDPYTRKAPYHYGWDWGPRYVTEGIWLPVKLIAWDDLRIDNFHIRQQKISKDEAELWAEFDVVAFCQAVAAEGGPSPEHVLAWYEEVFKLRPAMIDATLAAISGYFADRGWRPPIEGLPRVRRWQRDQLKECLHWAARRFDLPEPRWLDAVVG